MADSPFDDPNDLQDVEDEEAWSAAVVAARQNAPRDLATLAREVIQVLDACNLSGVVYSFSAACTSLWDIAHREHHDTDWVNTHPICILYSSKIAGLTGREDLSGEALDRFGVAYRACKELAKEW